MRYVKSNEQSTHPLSCELDRRNEAKQQPLYRWQPQGAYRDVKAGDTPYGPPNCLCLFRKENSITPTCETMHFPLG